MGISFMRGGRRVLAALALLQVGVGAASATTYDVGAGWQFPTLSSVPWTTLAPGDTVNIHWQPQPYREHILLSQSGTAAQHIVVRGISDPATGKRPVLDGDNAALAPGTPMYQSLWGLGVVTVSSRNGMTPWTYVPKYLDIENLEVRNARVGLNYKDPTGAVKPYGTFSTAVYIEKGDHITVRNCELTASGLGLFANSKYGSAALSSNLLVEHNYIHHNGVVNGWKEHNCYTECDGIVYQYNRIGPVIAGSYGDAIKDRSAGAVIRYNWIESGPADCLDLVDADSDYPYLMTLPNWDKTWVYGNTFYNGPNGASWLILFSKLTGSPVPNAKATLYFYNNTIVNQQDKNPRWASYLFLFLPTQLRGGPDLEHIDARNNVVYTTSATPGAAAADFYLVWADTSAFLDLGRNWLSPGVQPLSYRGPGAFPGAITGWNLQKVGDQNGLNNPGFVDFAHLDLRLASSSSCIDLGLPLPPATVGFEPVFEYRDLALSTPRAIQGSAIDLGAYEDSGLPAAAPQIGIQNAATLEGNSGQKNLVFTVALTSPASAPVTFHYATQNGTATAGSDYVATSGNATIPAGQTSVTIAVPIVGDTAVEPNESFTVALSGVQGAGVLVGQATGSILNDDAPASTAPQITGFTPGSGPVGTVVTLTGKNFTGVTAVQFKNSAATFTVVNSTTIQTTVPAGAATGRIYVTSPAGSGATSSDFVVTG